MFSDQHLFTAKLVCLVALCIGLVSSQSSFGQTDTEATAQKPAEQNQVGEQRSKTFLPIVFNTTAMSQQASELINEGALTISLSAEKSIYQASEGILLRFTLTNSSESTLHILQWGTPFDGFKRDMFVITTEGVRVAYSGKLVKRGEPSQADYFSLQPGEERSVIVDLTEGYAIQTEGDYLVEWATQLLDVRSQLVLNRLQKSYQPLQVTPAHARFILQGNREIAQVRRGDSPTACSTDEQQAVTAALQSARTMATDARNAFQNVATPAQAARYITWFGPHDNTRYTSVQNHFTSIRDALAGQTFDWECNPPADDCGNAFAYVYANQPYKIYLCSGFWNAANTGTDSRPGVIIHEASHFNVVAGTDDHFYGHDNSLSSAQNSPALAVNNADSHEYFAEDVESLPMTAITDPVRARCSHTSTEIGTEDLPYNSIIEGINAVANNGTLQIEAGCTASAMTISKPMTLQALNGIVSIGQ